MNKKVISAMLAASMAVSLAACGSTATSEATSAVSSETSSTVASGESAASGSYTGTPIKVGGIGPITGAAATYGNAVKNAENWLSKRSTPQTAAMFLTGSSRTMSTMLKRASTLTTP